MEEERKRLLFIGLGNPGGKYANTRHNIGFLVLDRLAEIHGVHLKETSKFEGEMGKYLTDEGEFFLLKPKTYMNLSGRSVRKAMSYYRFKPTEIVVVYDDIAIPFGEIRFRQGGGAGGHNGLKSVAEMIGTKEYPRLRVGIEGSGYRGRNLDDYVLSPFSKAEEYDLPMIVDKGAKILMRLGREDAERVMNDVNTRVKKNPEEGQENNHESRETKSL